VDISVGSKFVMMNVANCMMNDYFITET